MSDVNTINEKNEENGEPVKEEEQIHLPEGDSSVTNMLLKIFGIDKTELEALGKVKVSQLKGILLSTLKDNAVGISTALLAFVPFIGEYFLAGKALYKEGEDVKDSVMKKIRDKINLQIPDVKIPEVSIPKSLPLAATTAIPVQTVAPTVAPTLVSQGGASKRNSNAILRRIEKSKKAFHNTNKAKKPRKTRRLQRGRRVSK
jgi:hypothetical protein